MREVVPGEGSLGTAAREEVHGNEYRDVAEAPGVSDMYKTFNRSFYGRFSVFINRGQKRDWRSTLWKGTMNMFSVMG